MTIYITKEEMETRILKICLKSFFQEEYYGNKVYINRKIGTYLDLKISL
jgi:hypothetical protein